MSRSNHTARGTVTVLRGEHVVINRFDRHVAPFPNQAELPTQQVSFREF